MSGPLDSPNQLITTLDEEGLQELYTWIDEINLSRPKRSIWRDFSDGVLVAEIVSHFLPKMVEIHNYSSASSISQKLTNWDTLNRKVLSKLNYIVPKTTLKDVAECKPGVIEVVLANLRMKIEKYIAKKKADSLRKQQQVYDEFSPNGPISDHEQYLYDDGQGYLGPENNYGYAFNTSYAQQRNPGNDQQAAGPYGSLPYQSGPVPYPGPDKSGGDSPRGANTRHKSIIKDGKGGAYAGGPLGEKSKLAPVHQGKGKVPRSQSYQDVNGTMDPQSTRLLLEEKEQALLASQETVQILNVKIRRLEHLLHLKDLRIDDLSKRLQLVTQPLPRQLPPQANPPHPPTVDPQIPSMHMHHQNPLPPLHHSSYNSQQLQ
ncbi:Sperm flagellar protein 1 [Desmophyllum pertusum]|uniref:Sperm flagellar protein 1 n=1 Tax=Desmophyllum pertusum TaxID=174260 RepID=A0A9X0CJM3_9CNID|nr:Sperm flagellar protein 1 [Desmophyllum pertusum]